MMLPEQRLAAAPGVTVSAACVQVSPHLAIETRRLAAGGVLPHQPHSPADQQVQALRRVVLPVEARTGRSSHGSRHDWMLGRLTQCCRPFLADDQSGA